jgi:superkiller protein 3
VKKSDKMAVKKHQVSARRIAARPRSAIWLWLAVGAVVLALLVWKISPPEPAPTGAGFSDSKTGASPSLAEESLAEPEQERALRREQLQAAEKLVTEYPTNDDAVYLAGLVHNEQGDSDAAMTLWTRALELDPTRADASESLGHAFLLRDDYEQAEQYLRKALGLDSNLETARYRLAVALSHQGNMQEVVSVLGQARSLSADAHRLLGETFQQLKQYHPARTNYEAAIRLKPDLADAYYGLSRVCAQLGEPERSADYWEKFSALKKASEEEGRRWRARFSPLSVAKRSVAQTHTDVGRVYLTQGRAREAEQLWRRASMLDPSNALCRLQLAVHCQRTRRPQEALRFYEEVARIDPNDGLAHLNLGRVCLKLNRFERAERAFNEVIRLAPNQPEGHSALAELFLQTNRNLDEARRLAEKAVSLAPEAQHFALLGQACAMNRDRAGALAAFNRAIDLQPDNAQYHRLRDTLLGNEMR